MDALLGTIPTVVAAIVRFRLRAGSDREAIAEVAGMFIAFAVLLLYAWWRDRRATKTHRRAEPAERRRLLEARRIIAQRQR